MGNKDTDFFGVDTTTVYVIMHSPTGQSTTARIYKYVFSKSRYQMSTQFKMQAVSGTATWVTVPVSRAILPYKDDEGRTFINWFAFGQLTEEQREKHWTAYASGSRTYVVSGDGMPDPPTTELSTLTAAQLWYQNNLGTAAQPKVTPYLFYPSILDDNTRTNLVAFNDIKHIVLQNLG